MFKKLREILSVSTDLEKSKNRYEKDRVELNERSDIYASLKTLCLSVSSQLRNKECKVLQIHFVGTCRKAVLVGEKSDVIQRRINDITTATESWRLTISFYTDLL